MNDFKEGNIYRLYMKNFLTYSEIEIFPGSHLNIVFGPNGSGKSSILCAICIVFGGKPELTGRGKDLTDYIRHGEEKATIEIELIHSKRNIVIKRTFRQNGRSSFYCQGKEQSQKEILQRVKKIGICIDNLCQFLPQDRVTEFSKLNKIQLLNSTQTAIGESELADQHQALCQQGKTADEIANQVLNLQKQLTDEKGKNNLLTDQVEAINNEKKLNKLIKQLKGLRLQRQYVARRQELKDLEPVINLLYKKIEDLKKGIQPMKKNEQEIQNKINAQMVLIKQLNTRTSKMEHAGNMHEEKIIQHQGAMETEEIEFQAHQKYCNQRAKEIDDLKHTIQVMEGHLQQQDDINESHFQSEVKELTRKISLLSEKLSEFKSNINEKTYMMVVENNKRAQVERSLKNLQDSKERRLKLLLQTRDSNERKRYQTVYEAAGWIQQNMDKFQGPVHGPMYTIIESGKASSGKYIENTVSKNDLIAFICEFKDDVNLLKRYADSFNWSINILHSDPSSMNTFAPTIPIEALRRIGFEVYLKDVITAPPAVIEYLCSIYQIHNIAIGNDADFSSVPDTLLHFFIGNDRFDKSISKYDGESSITVSQLHDVFFMSINTNEKHVADVRNEMQAITERIEAMQSANNKLREQEQNMEKELEDLRREKQQLQNRLQQKLQLVTKIAQRRMQLARREEEELDLPGAMLKMKSKMKNIVAEMLKLADEHVALTEEMSSVTLNKFQVCLKIASLKQEKQKLDASMEEAQFQISEAENTHDIQRNKVTELKQKLRQLKNSLCSHLECSINDLKDPNSTIRSDLEDGYVNYNLEEIEQLLADTQARKECLISPEENVLYEFHKREGLIKKLEKDIENKSVDAKKCQTNLDQAKADWLPKMDQLAEQISQHFSSFMRRLGCAGVVTLDKGSNETDFAQYGLSIKVQFRDTESLKELTAHQQSGGERSVSTALYLMALQTLTTVPFRCVDEINQGMDAYNEKRMFNMLVETSTAQSASQYFFITPKLISDLPCSPKVKYLNIINGPYVPPYKELRAKNMLENLRKSLQK